MPWRARGRPADAGWSRKVHCVQMYNFRINESRAHAHCRPSYALRSLDFPAADRMLTSATPSQPDCVCVRSYRHVATGHGQHAGRMQAADRENAHPRLRGHHRSTVSFPRCIGETYSRTGSSLVLLIIYNMCMALSRSILQSLWLHKLARIGRRMTHMTASAAHPHSYGKSCARIPLLSFFLWYACCNLFVCSYIVLATGLHFHLPVTY